MRRRKPRQQASSGSVRGPFFKSIPVSLLTGKEREDWIVGMGELARGELADALTQVEALTARVEPFQTMAVMAGYALMRFVKKDQYRDSVIPEVQQGHVEFLQAMYLRLPPSTALSQSTPDDIQVLFDQLPRLFAAQHQARLPTRESVDRPSTVDESALRVLQEYLRAHTTVVRNWGFFSSVTRISRELLSGIDQQFKAQYGLAASDVVRLFEHLVRRQEKRVSEHWARLHEVLRLATVDEMVDTFFARFPFGGETAETAEILKREALTTRRLNTALLPMADEYLAAEFFFSSDQIAQETGLPTVAVERLLGQLSLSFGALADTPIDGFFLENPVWLKPLIALDSPGQYFCALPQTLMSFVYQIVDELVKPYPELAKQLSKVRSNFLENEVERLLKLAFPEAQVVPRFKWRDGDQEFETDVMLRFDSTILLVEAKSAKVSWPALRGAPGRLLRDVRELIVAPSEQSGRLAAKLQKETAIRAAGDASQMSFPLQLDKVTAVVRLSVCLQDFATVQSVPSLLARAGVLNNQYPLAPCISLSDLEVLIDLLEEPHVRLHYIRQRASTMLAQQVVGDELDMLGLYLDTSLNFGGLQPGEQDLALNGYSARLDRYYMAKDEGEHARKPRRATIAWFNRLCEQISKRPTFGWSELTGALLSLAPFQQQKVEREVHKIARRIREGKPIRDGKDTLVLVGPEWTTTALAIRARDRRQPGKYLEGAQHLVSGVFEHEHVERCCVFVVDALDQQLPYLGGAIFTRLDRPVSATIFF